MNIKTFICYKDNIIQRIYETSDDIEGVTLAIKNENLDDDLIIKEVPNSFIGTQYSNIDEYEDDFSKQKSLSYRVSKGYYKLKKDEKLDGEIIVKKTLKEQIEDGSKELQDHEKYDEETDSIISKSWKELIDSGVKTIEDYLDIVRNYRNQLLNECDLIYCNPERWYNYNDSLKQLWSNYKQQLRDFTDKKLEIVDDISKLNWPVKPT